MFTRLRFCLGMLGKPMFFICILLLHNSNAIANPSVLKSAGALAFGPKNTLFLGDSRAAKIHAFEFSNKQLEKQDYTWGRAASFEGRTVVSNIDHKIADLLNANANDVVINDMVVHKDSGQIFLSVHDGKGPDAKPALIQVKSGSLNKVDLSKVKHSSISIKDVPQTNSLEFGQPLNNLAITDIDYYQGELYVAGISNDIFSSKLRRIAFPFNNEVKTSSIEIWHAVHAQYETRSPIITQEIKEIAGEPTLIAVYACTPIVKIPLKDLKDGAKVRGTMIGEMGYGNTPIDIVSFNNPMDKNEYVLVTNTNRSAAQISLNAIETAEPMPAGEGVGPVFSVAGVAQYPMPMAGTLHLDTIDVQWAITVRRHPEDLGRIDLHTLPIPFFFDRADHIVEMNFEGAPDPFGYKGLPPVDYK